MPAASRLRSSMIPNCNAADNPNTDQVKGIIKIPIVLLCVFKSNKPNVKMVVGQGRPKVGEYGNLWPRK